LSVSQGLDSDSQNSNTSSPPAFLEKFGIDQQTLGIILPNINWHPLDISLNSEFPFEDNYFQVITMLAVIEHLDPEKLVDIFIETR
jgi:hypothetical protein